ncbi:MAG: hypothetical protein K0R73_1359 [Candidatus Midichloriaceae bacterium]|jgi:hypothetical protein|nr:hypothetical protein [Candidatus Midichloriaceae bacterium]
MPDFGKVRGEKAVEYFTYSSIFYQANLAKGEL